MIRCSVSFYTLLFLFTNTLLRSVVALYMFRVLFAPIVRSVYELYMQIFLVQSSMVWCQSWLVSK